MQQPLNLDQIETRAHELMRVSGLSYDQVAARLAQTDVPAMAAEIRRLRDQTREYGELAARRESELIALRARVTELEGPAIEAKRNEIRQSFTEIAAQCEQDHDYEAAANFQRRLREREEQWAREDAAEETHVVTDDSSGPETDTLPAWLRQRFDPHGPDWEQLSDDDRAYWEHHARAVRRAVARGGFKTNPTAQPAASRP